MNQSCCFAELILTRCALSVQLRDQLGAKSFLPTFSFLGSLIEAVPDAAHSLVTQYGETRQPATRETLPTPHYVPLFRTNPPPNAPGVSDRRPDC